MFRCCECGIIFDKEDVSYKQICFEDEYGVSNLFQSKNYTTIQVCPNCVSKELEELERCDICEQWYSEEELFDVSEYRNGFNGCCCQKCIDDNYMYKE